MRSFDDAFGFNDFIELQDDVFEEGSQKSDKTDDSKQIVMSKELEWSYKQDPIVFNTINKLTQLIMHPTISLKGTNSKFFNDFLKGIGTRGGNDPWVNILQTIFRYQMIYGNCYIEKVFDSEGRITDLEIIDPTSIDFARNNNGQILLDRRKNPVGYVQKVGNGVGLQKINSPDPEPKDLQTRSNQIFISSERIVHFKMNTVGAGFIGIGLVEPAYKLIKAKHNLEKELSDAALRKGTGIFTAKVGDQNHRPTRKLLETALQKMKKADHKNGLAGPHYVEYGMLETKYAAQFLDFLSYYIEQQIASMGTPKAFAMGSGEETNRATLNRQEHMTKVALKDFIRSTVERIHTQIFKPIAEDWNKTNFPKITWGELILDELNDKALRLERYSKAGILPDAENLQEKILELENLGESDESNVLN